MESSTPHQRNSESSEDDKRSFVSKMALYDLQIARSTLASISHKPTWTIADTASFDCMHYDGDAALDLCAHKLVLRPDQRVLDIGSGFSATGRFLALNYYVHVTGVELQPEVHELAETITRKNAVQHVVRDVRSVNADFLTLTEDDIYGQGAHVPFDHALSLLCIMHLPQSARRPFFEQVHKYLKAGGRIYIEDFYQRKPLIDEERAKLRDLVACTFLPTKSEYTATIAEFGFDVNAFEDVTEHWRDILVARAKKYKAQANRNPDLEKFYDTVAELFFGGNLGGVRLTATKRLEGFYWKREAAQ